MYDYRITEKIHNKMPSFKWVNDGSLMSVYYDGQDGKRNPALEFVNAICKVFELDSTMEEEVFNRLRVKFLKYACVWQYIKTQHSMYKSRYQKIK